MSKIITLAGAALAAVTLLPPSAHAQTETTFYTFRLPKGARPVAGMIHEGGILYGTTLQGGALGGGTVFRLSSKTGLEVVLHSFSGGSGGDGSGPNSSLLYLNGLLYGTTASGGAAPFGGGTVFTVNPTTGAETVLYSFAGGTDGEGPTGALIHVDGVLYGTTTYGGGAGCGAGLGCGTVFRLKPPGAAGGAWTETVLHRFSGSRDGERPGGLTYLNGFIFGTTTFGGSSRLGGTIFRVEAASGVESVLYYFKGGADGAEPNGGLISHNGFLFGTTGIGGFHGPGFCSSGCGTVFKVNPSTGSETVLHSFTGGADGAEAFTYEPNTLTFQGGSLYGATAGGPPEYCFGYGCGTVYKLDPTTGAKSVLYNFTGGADGDGPNGGLVYLNGALYGTTFDGGAGPATCVKQKAGGCGVVFKLTP